MAHRLSVTVQINLDGMNARLLVTGCLTEASQQALPPLIGRASSLTAGIQVTIDLSGADHIEAAGVDLLRWAIDNDPRCAPVELVLPYPLPCHPTTATSPHRGTAGASPSSDHRRATAA